MVLANASNVAFDIVLLNSLRFIYYTNRHILLIAHSVSAQPPHLHNWCRQAPLMPPPLLAALKVRVQFNFAPLSVGCRACKYHFGCMWASCSAPPWPRLRAGYFQCRDANSATAPPRLPSVLLAVVVVEEVIGIHAIFMRQAGHCESFWRVLACNSPHKNSTHVPTHVNMLQWYYMFYVCTYVTLSWHGMVITYRMFYCFHNNNSKLSGMLVVPAGTVWRRSYKATSSNNGSTVTASTAVPLALATRNFCVVVHRWCCCDK